MFLPDRKELHYFDLNYDKGLHWYAGNFLAADNQVAGEITPNYYQYPGALERIKNDLPDSKLVYIIREPKARLFSQFELFKQVQYKDLTFAQAMGTHPELFDLSLQGKHLGRLLELFERDQLLVLLYDELESNPLALLREVYNFLGVDNLFEPKSLHSRVNKVVFPRTQALLEQLHLTFIVDLIKASPAAESAKKLGSNKLGRKGDPVLAPSYQRALHLDILEIERLLQVDLDHWKALISPDTST